MPRTFKRPASVVLVVGYAILVAIMVHRARRGTAETRRQSQEGPAARPADAIPLAAAPSSHQTPDFHWRQMESADYRTYIANLRSIGCPEQTIRDIIIADVHQVYEERRLVLQRHRTRIALLEFSRAMSDPNSPLTPDQALARLRSEESNVISVLLGPTSPVAAADSSSDPTSKGGRGLNQTVAIPLAFQDLKPDGMTLESRQIEVLNELRRKFRDDLSGASQDPADPAYRKRWQVAQRENDDLLSGLLGGQFYLDYELEVSERAPKP